MKAKTRELLNEIFPDGIPDELRDKLQGAMLSLAGDEEVVVSRIDKLVSDRLKEVLDSAIKVEKSYWGDPGRLQGWAVDEIMKLVTKTLAPDSLRDIIHTTVRSEIKLAQSAIIREATTQAVNEWMCANYSNGSMKNMVQETVASEFRKLLNSYSK